MVLLLTIALVALAVVYFYISFLITKKKYAHLPGPGNPKFPMGHLGLIDFNNAIIYQHWIKLKEHYGKIFVFWLGNVPVMTVSDASCVQDIMITHNRQKADLMKKGLVDVVGSGLLLSEGEEHKKRRKLFGPAFHLQFMKNMSPKMNSKTNQLINMLLDRHNNQAVEIGSSITATTLDIIGVTAFDTDFGAIEDEHSALAQASETVLQELFARGIDPLRQYYCFSAARKFNQAMKTIERAAYDAINKRKEQLAKDPNSEEAEDILGIILEHEKSGELSTKEIIQEIITFLIAGHETTANTLAFCIAEITRNSDIEKRLVEEIDAVLGDKDEVDWEDLNKLKYTQLVFKEALRLYPPAPSTLRQTGDDYEVIGGLRIPPKTPLFMSCFMVQRDPDYWVEPLKFDPERWERDEIKPYTYFPFMLGSRNCIGQFFAQVESTIMLALLFKKIKFTLLDQKDKRPDIMQQLTIKPKGGVHVKIERRL